MCCACGGAAESPDADVLDADRADRAALDASLLDAPDSADASSLDVGSDALDVRDAGGDVALDAGAGPLILWMAADGDDRREGRSAEEAVLTLGRIQAILAADPPDRDVEVRIQAGTYFAQRVTWTVTSPDHTIAFRRAHDDGERPVFDGCTAGGSCEGGTFFRLRHSAGEETNLTFHYLHVQRYQTAISLDGDRDAEATSNGSNTIFGCYFDRIGNVFAPSLEPSTAALRLVNSDDNRIENNHFVDVVNTSSGGLIHGIYVAHMSDRNTIARNRFLRSTGDPVRVRDFSNDNVIVDNRFIRVGTAAGYTEWYCDHAARTDCTKPDVECPSWGNEFRRNTLDGTWSCDTLSTFHYFQDDSTPGCSPPSTTARRLSTSANETTPTPCSMD